MFRVGALMQHVAFSNLADIAAAYQKECEACVSQGGFREPTAGRKETRKPWLSRDQILKMS